MKVVCHICNQEIIPFVEARDTRCEPEKFMHFRCSPAARTHEELEQAGFFTRNKSRRSIGDGKTAIALKRLIEKEFTEHYGHAPDDIYLWSQRGFYRHRAQDMVAWGAEVLVGKLMHHVYSWGTMTQCVKQGKLKLNFSDHLRMEC